MIAWKLFVLLAGFLLSFCDIVVGRATGGHVRVAQGEEVILSTPGDSGDGCKFVYQDPRTDTTCCYSASHRRQTLCDPDIQSPGCRMDPAFRVVEEVVDDHRVTVGCGLRLLDVQPRDAGQYLVIFPARLEDNIRMVLELEVKEKASRTGEDAEEKEMPWKTREVMALLCVGTFVGTFFGIFIGKFYKKISFQALMTHNGPIKTPRKSASNSPMNKLMEVYEIMISGSKSANKAMGSYVKNLKESPTKTFPESPMKALPVTTPKNCLKTSHEENTPYQIGRRPRKGTLNIRLK